MNWQCVQKVMTEFVKCSEKMILSLLNPCKPLTNHMKFIIMSLGTVLGGIMQEGMNRGGERSVLRVP